jgi:hypothetical protein
MRSDDDKRKLQARQRALTNRLNRTTSAPSQVSGATAATPPPRRREDSATSVVANEANEQQPRPSRSPFPHAAAPADIPSTTTEPSMPDEPETGTPDSSGAGSDTPRPSRSATEPGESAAVIADSHVEPSRDSEHPPSDQPRNDGETAAAVSSDSAQPPPTSGTPRSGSAGRAADTDSDPRPERHAKSSPPSSATDAQTQAPAHPASSASSSPEPPTPARRARPAPQSAPSSTSSSAVKAGETALPKDKTARDPHRISPPTATPDPAHSTASGPADTSVNRVYDHTAATDTADSSGQPSSSPGQHNSATSRSSDKKPPSPGSTARPATHDHPPTGTPTPTARNHRDDREQP